MEARPVIKNKFWIVEDAGQQVATIQAAPDGVVLVKDARREKFTNFKLLSAKYNIRAGKAPKTKKPDSELYDIYGFPTDCRPYNEIYDVRRRLPFFTKTAKSKSFYCAGHYAVNINGVWSNHFCPKSITVSRYKCHGPFKSKEDSIGKIDELKNAESR